MKKQNIMNVSISYKFVKKEPPSQKKGTKKFSLFPEVSHK